MPRPRVRRTRRGDFQLKLGDGERELLRTLPGELREVLGSDDPALRRLFPPAYRDHADHEAEYQHLMHDELLGGHLSAIDVIERTVDAERLSEDEMAAWLRALNALRLYLGTRIDVTEEMYDEVMDPGDPRAPVFALYTYLGWLEEQVVEALATD